MRAIKGFFYEFHKERIVSRPGAPLVMREGMEIGPPITWEEAITLQRHYSATSADAS
jgi:hypothetical protein